MPIEINENNVFSNITDSFFQELTFSETYETTDLDIKAISTTLFSKVSETDNKIPVQSLSETNASNLTNEKMRE